MFAVESQSYEETFKQIGLFVAGAGTFLSAFSAFWQSRQAKIGVNETKIGVNANAATAIRLEDKFDKLKPGTEGRDSMMLALEKSLPRIRQEMEIMADERINAVKATCQKRIDELESELALWKTGQKKPTETP